MILSSGLKKNLSKNPNLRWVSVAGRPGEDSGVWRLNRQWRKGGWIYTWRRHWNPSKSVRAGI